MAKRFLLKLKRIKKTDDLEEDSPKLVTSAYDHEVPLGCESMNKGFGYTGPMSVADITLESWNNYFAEGGNLNQPTWLQNNRLKEIRKNFEHLARYHGAS
jgi:hypothetical protein